MPAHKKPRLEKICPTCGQPFYVLPGESKRKYCSKSCFNNRGHAMATCLNCGAEFSVWEFENRKFCSRLCSNAYHSNPMVSKVCPECKREFTSRDYKKRIFCSRECYLNHIRREPHVCPQCGQSYTPEKHSDQKYCSPECQALASRSRITIHCEECGKEISVMKSRVDRTKYCSKKCQLLNMFSSCDERRVVGIISGLLDEAPLRQHTWDWLINPESERPLHVDAYFPQHNLAVEYDGKQHRQFLPFYHKTRQQFLELQHRDEVKEHLLKQHNIPLVRITSKEPKTISHIVARVSAVLARFSLPIQPSFPSFYILCDNHSSRGILSNHRKV